MSTNNPASMQKESMRSNNNYPMDVSSFVPFAITQQQLYLQRQQQQQQMQQQQQQQQQLDQRQNKFKLSHLNLTQPTPSDYASHDDDDVGFLHFFFSNC